MYKIINEYMSRLNLQSDSKIQDKISEVLGNRNEINRYSVSVHFNQFIIDIRLKNFSVEHAEALFMQLMKELSYSHSALYVRFNEGSCVRYRFLTSRENKEGLYCDFVIS
ncbi:MAG: hypothetical protein ACI4EK_00305 [Wujia sp.]